MPQKHTQPVFINRQNSTVSVPDPSGRQILIPPYAEKGRDPHAAYEVVGEHYAQFVSDMGPLYPLVPTPTVPGAGPPVGSTPTRAPRATPLNDGGVAGAVGEFSRRAPGDAPTPEGQSLAAQTPALDAKRAPGVGAKMVGDLAATPVIQSPDEAPSGITRDGPRAPSKSGVESILLSPTVKGVEKPVQEQPAERTKKPPRKKPVKRRTKKSAKKRAKKRVKKSAKKSAGSVTGTITRRISSKS